MHPNNPRVDSDHDMYPNWKARRRSGVGFRDFVADPTYPTVGPLQGIGTTAQGAIEVTPSPQPSA